MARLVMAYNFAQDHVVFVVVFIDLLYTKRSKWISINALLHSTSLMMNFKANLLHQIRGENFQ